MQETIIQAHAVCFQYPDAAQPAVDHVSLDVNRGEFLAVLGRNGSGKSTFAKLLNALLIPTEGTVVVDGHRATGEEDCAFGLENMGVDPVEIRRRVDETLAEVGMEKFAEASPSMLSGGQKQRVAVAGVLAMRPKVIVFDESTAMLDPVGRHDVFTLAQKLNRNEGITIVWITHFLDEAVRADRVVVMDAGRISMQGTPREVFSHVQQIRSLGLDVPEMMQLSAELRAAGLDGLSESTMTVEEMAEELCRLKSRS